MQIKKANTIEGIYEAVLARPLELDEMELFLTYPGPNESGRIP